MSCPSVNSGTRDRKRLRKQRGQSQTLLEANDAILNSHGVQAKLENCDDGRYRD